MSVMDTKRTVLLHVRKRIGYLTLIFKENGRKIPDWVVLDFQKLCDSSSISASPVSISGRPGQFPNPLIRAVVDIESTIFLVVITG